MNQKLMQQMLLVNEIMRLALLVNNLSQHNVFIDYSGHVNTIECRIYENGWQENADPTETIKVRFNSIDGGFSMLNKVQEYLKDLYMNIEVTELVQKGAECFVW